MELRVRPGLADYAVLELMKWAWERCVSALHFGVLGMERLRRGLLLVLLEVR